MSTTTPPRSPVTHLCSPTTSGELYERSIREAGICADHLVVQPNRKTASCAVVSERAGMQRTMRTLFVDAARLDVGELREELLAASFCFVSSYTCYFEGMIERLVELGEAAGCSILLDLGSFEIVKRWVLISTDDVRPSAGTRPPSDALTRASLGRVSSRFSGRLDGLFRRVDYCVCNEDEAAAFAKVHFTGSSDDYKNDEVFDATAAWMLDHGVKSAVIITLGERGSILYERSPPSPPSSSGVTRTDVAAVRLDDGAVDPTGAGDAFCAGLLYALATRKPLHAAVKTASAAGAAAVKSVGAELSPSALQWFRDECKITSYMYH